MHAILSIQTEGLGGVEVVTIEGSTLADDENDEQHAKL